MLKIPVKQSGLAAGAAVPCEVKPLTPLPAVVTRHRESVHRLSVGARTSKLLVGVTLRPTKLDDEVFALSPSRSLPTTPNSNGANTLEEHNTHRWVR